MATSVHPARPDVRRRVLAAAALLAAAGVSRRALAHAGHRHAPPAGVATAEPAWRPRGLVDTAGRRFDLARYAGRPVLLTFGFTQCSSTCPISLQAAAELLARPGADRIQVVFVTLEPLADDPARLAKYLGAFSPAIVGVTGEPGAIEAMAESFRVGVQRTPNEPLAHSSMWYLIDERGAVRAVARHDATPSELDAGLSRIRLGAR